MLLSNYAWFLAMSRVVWHTTAIRDDVDKPIALTSDVLLSSASLALAPGKRESVPEGMALMNASSRTQVRRMDPFVAPALTVTVAVGKAVNVGMKVWRRRNMESTLDKMQSIHNAINDRKETVCLQARSFEIRVVLIQKLFFKVLAFSEEQNKHRNLSKLTSTLTTRFKGELDKAIHRLVQEGCHQMSAAEATLLTNINKLTEDISDLSGEILQDSFGAAFGALTSSLLVLADVEASADNDILKEKFTVSKTEIKTAKETIDQVLEGEEIGISLGLVKPVVSALAALWEGFEEVFKYIGDKVPEFLGSILGVAQDLVELYKNGAELFEIWREGKPSLRQIGAPIVEIAVNGISLLTHCLSLFDTKFPPLQYVSLSLKIALESVKILQNAMALQTEGEEHAAMIHAALDARNQMIGYTRKTCTAMVVAANASNQERLALVKLLNDAEELNGGDMADPNMEVLYKIFEEFCFNYVGACAALAGDLAADSSMTEAVKKHSSELFEMADIAPISDFAFCADHEHIKFCIDSYRTLGFEKAFDTHTDVNDEIGTLLVCRGCGNSVVFSVEEVPMNEESITNVSSQFYDARKTDGSSPKFPEGLPESSTLTFVYTSSATHVLAVYKALYSEIYSLGNNYAALVDLKRYVMYIDIKKQDGAFNESGWRDSNVNMLKSSNVQDVLLWEKDSDKASHTFWDRHRWDGATGEYSFAKVETYAIFDAVGLVYAEKVSNSGMNTEKDYVDWRKTKESSEKKPFRFASLLEGCGCHLLLGSQWASSKRYGIRAAPLDHVIGQHAQHRRCDVQVGIWVSDVNLTENFGETPLNGSTQFTKCTVLQTERLTNEVMGRRQLYASVDRNTEQTPLVKFELQNKVINEAGGLIENANIAIWLNTLDEISGQIPEFSNVSSDVKHGGPLKDLVCELQDHICSESSYCTFRGDDVAGSLLKAFGRQPFEGIMDKFDSATYGLGLEIIAKNMENEIEKGNFIPETKEKLRNILYNPEGKHWQLSSFPLFNNIDISHDAEEVPVYKVELHPQTPPKLEDLPLEEAVHNRVFLATCMHAAECSTDKLPSIVIENNAIVQRCFSEPNVPVLYQPHSTVNLGICMTLFIADGEEPADDAADLKNKIETTTFEFLKAGFGKLTKHTWGEGDEKKWNMAVYTRVEARMNFKKDKKDKICSLCADFPEDTAVQVASAAAHPTAEEAADCIGGKGCATPMFSAPMDVFRLVVDRATKTFSIIKTKEPDRMTLDVRCYKVGQETHPGRKENGKCYVANKQRCSPEIKQTCREATVCTQFEQWRAGELPELKRIWLCAKADWAPKDWGWNPPKWVRVEAGKEGLVAFKEKLVNENDGNKWENSQANDLRVIEA